MAKQAGQLIRSLRQDRGLTQRQLAERIGMNFTYLSKMENGRLDSTPSAETLTAMAEALDVESDWLLAQCGRVPQSVANQLLEHPAMLQQISAFDGGDFAERWRTPYRLAGTVPAGPTMEAVEDTEEFDISELFSPGEHYALRVRGESMIDAGILDGDIAIVRPQPICRDGDIVIALVDGYEATLKKLYRENHLIRLQPCNDAMEPIVVPAEAVEIRGKVVAIIRPKV